MITVRKGHHRTRLWFALLAGLVALVVGGASLAYAAVAEVNVTFTGSGTPPLTCSSTPDVSGISIPHGTKVNLINRTGVRATIFVNGQEGVSLDNGMGVRVKLRVGQHRIEMRPDCLVGVPSEALVVTVVLGVLRPSATPTASGSAQPPSDLSGARPPGASAAATSAPPGPSSNGFEGVPYSGSDRGGDGTGGDGAAASGTTGFGGVGGSEGAASGEDGVQPEGAAASDAAGSGEAPPVETEFGTFDQPYLAIAPLDNRGSYLLAVIALICIFGVGAGIIRAILAQRADKVLAA
jgi:hypothetical protein